MKNINTDYHSLNRIWVEAKVCEESNDITIDEAIKFLKKSKTKAKKLNFEDLKIHYAYYEGDENSLPQSSIVVNGWRLETEEEWHRRIEERKRAIQRNIDNAEATVARKTNLNQTIEAIDKALEKSSLKCKVCGKHCSYITYRNNKPERICCKCDEEREDRENLKAIKVD